MALLPSEAPADATARGLPLSRCASLGLSRRATWPVPTHADAQAADCTAEEKDSQRGCDSAQLPRLGVNRLNPVCRPASQALPPGCAAAGEGVTCPPAPRPQPTRVLAPVPCRAPQPTRGCWVLEASGEGPPELALQSQVRVQEVTPHLPGPETGLRMAGQAPVLTEPLCPEKLTTNCFCCFWTLPQPSSSRRQK